jgi:hypothetical protein
VKGMIDLNKAVRNGNLFHGPIEERHIEWVHDNSTPVRAVRQMLNLSAVANDIFKTSIFVLNSRFSISCFALNASVAR